MSDDTLEAGETRLRMKVQRGDGPDRRGEVDVEMIRERSTGDELLSTGEDYQTEGEPFYADHGNFAEFAFEIDRAVTLLEDQLGIEDQSADEA